MIVFKDFFFMNKFKNSAFVLFFFSCLFVFVFKICNSENIQAVWPSSPELEGKGQ